MWSNVIQYPDFLIPDIILRACKIKQTDETEMMWHFIEKVPGLRKTKLEISSEDNLSPIRLTLDYIEDYWLLLTVLRILDMHATQKDIKKLFMSNPNLHEVNWFRNDEYKATHVAKI